MDNKTLTGGITNDSGLEYTWVTEPGACEKCKALDGTTYKTADDVPDKPHPNCKCHVRVRKNRITATDPLERLREERKQQKNAQIDKERQEGQLKILVEEIDANIEYLEIKESILYRFEALHPKLDEGERANLEERKVVISNKIKELKDYKKFIVYGIADKPHSTDALNIGIQVIGYALPPAKELWNIAYTKFENFKDENSRFIGHPKYIKDEALKNRIIEKLKSQNMALDSRGVYFNSNSDVAKMIVKTDAFKDFLLRHKEDLLTHKTKLHNDSLGFSAKDLTGLLAYGKADIFDIVIDSDGTIHAKVLDTYDFNKYERYFLVKWGRNYQEDGKIEVYYSITDIVVQKKYWEQVLNERLQK